MGATATTGAKLKCPFGVAPGVFVATPSPIFAAGPNVGRCTDCIPFFNVSGFVLCKSLMNPITAAQTAAALGVLTPGTCIPTPAGTWLPINPSVLIMGIPILDTTSKLICAFGGGIIEVAGSIQSVVTE